MGRHGNLLDGGLDIVEAAFQLFAEELAYVSKQTNKRLRITANNAFAASWIMPRMPSLQALYP